MLIGIEDCLNRYKKLYLNEKKKYEEERKMNELLLEQLRKSERLLDMCSEAFKEFEKVKYKE